MGTEWIFGYGSLIWRPSFDYVERHKGWVVGWQRRFWQGSTDHRGSPGSPGRVVTLVEEPGAVCWGMLYRIRTELADGILNELDYREKAGYTRQFVDCHIEGEHDPRRTLTYVAYADNPNYLGTADDHAIVRQIAESTGPSGSNQEYLVRLHEEFRKHSIDDDHVTRLYELLTS